jgi:hypothetical protein
VGVASFLGFRSYATARLVGHFVFDAVTLFGTNDDAVTEAATTRFGAVVPFFGDPSGLGERWEII